ncbi:hypothetical protein ACHAW5_008222 [Stephanodiscus triporus]|uniref:Fe2OG dioxygenase domain-containing protein n=1 Tax=Stephanodiscus triporus TaxID=2934178 RepID=A0ABD3MDW6_9STRA
MFDGLSIKGESKEPPPPPAGSSSSSSVVSGFSFLQSFGGGIASSDADVDADADAVPPPPADSDADGDGGGGGEGEGDDGASSAMASSAFDFPTSSVAPVVPSAGTETTTTTATIVGGGSVAPAGGFSFPSGGGGATTITMETATTSGSPVEEEKKIAPERDKDGGSRRAGAAGDDDDDDDDEGWGGAARRRRPRRPGAGGDHRPRRRCRRRDNRNNNNERSLLNYSDCHIGVVGGGLAGLSSALAILRRPPPATDVDEHNDDSPPPSFPFRGRITLYERDSSELDRTEGYGMTLTYDPVGPLAELGVLEDVAKIDCPSRCHYSFDANGNVMGYLGNAFDDNDDGHGGGNGQRGNMRVPRSALRSILMNRLVSEAMATADANAAAAVDGQSSSVVRILWNKRLESYEDGPMTEGLNAIRGGRGGGDGRAREKKKEEEEDPRDRRRRPVLLRFDDGTTDRVDLLIGADGVNSVVARQYLMSRVPTRAATDEGSISTNGSGSARASESVAEISSSSLSSSSPRSLDVFIILGISDHFHPLVDERGFYTMDGTHRLFIMPFQGSRLDDVVDDDNRDDGIATTTRKERRRTMWQLSFPVFDASEAARLRRSSNTEEMRREVLRRCGHFHEPFPDMVRDTPISTIWGTSLLDRDPEEFVRHRASLEVHGRLPSRVVLVGDAAHPMSPFKGQGANQALADGVLLARWLRRSRPESAVRGFMTEMARRSAFKVRASREAARQLHSERCWEWLVEKEQEKSLPFHGVQARHVPTLLRTLRERGVGARTGSKLDIAIQDIIRELNIAEVEGSSRNTSMQLLSGSATVNDSNDDIIAKQQLPSSSREMILSQQQQLQSILQSQALEYAYSGNLSGLRQLSRKSHLIIPKALDINNQRRCLHLAAMHGHVDVCRWLLTEVNVDVDSLDADGKKAIDLAVDAGNCEETVRLLKKWTSIRLPMEQQSCKKNRGGDCGAMTSMVFDTLDSVNQDEDVSASKTGRVDNDVYRHFEQQLRRVRTVKELRSLLRKNRDSLGHSTNNDNHLVTQVLGCHLNDGDIERDEFCRRVLAERHGAVLLRNFIPREVDRLALGALALRPLNIDLPNALGNLHTSCGPIALHTVSISKSERKRLRKLCEEVKSRLFIPANASVIVQTNFGPQIQSDPSIEKDRPKKQRKINSFPLSKLRYVNIGEWNYNWNDRRYEKVQNAIAFPDRLLSLAQHAHDIAKRQTNAESGIPSISFDMAICNVYHLQRPSDRLGGHQDDVESDLSLPLVTVSLGAPGIFLLGGRSRQDIPTAILLRAGDCMVMSGNSRGYFHGVPSVLSNELDDDPGCSDFLLKGQRCVFPELSKFGTLLSNADEDNSSIPSLDEIRFSEAFLSTVRMNISIRRV